MQKEAMYYEKGEGGKVFCHLCPHNCTIPPDKVGICRVRKNIGGGLYSLIYGEVSSIAMDPIEKKPLYHFYPGSSILSIGTVGCSFRCKFCQNYTISQEQNSPTECYIPERLVRLAVKNDSIGIAYTYSEPLIWYEFVLDTCKEIKQEGLKNVFVTNGYINREPLEQLLPYVDAMNIDLKSFNDRFYRTVVGGGLQPVLDTIKRVWEEGSISVEVTTLIIPGYNDSKREMEELADFLSSLSADIPYHLTAYYPAYQLNAPPTPFPTLKRLRDIAQKKLNYVYLGNVGTRDDTLCSHCGALLVERKGYSSRVVNYANRRCLQCDKEVPIVG